MKVTNEKIENCQTFLTVEMEPEEVEESLEKSYRRLAEKANIPGFRKGKAPRFVVESHVGKEGLLEEALNELIPEAYDKALKEENINAFARPSIELIKTEPVTFKATVPLAPVVKLGDYHKVQLTLKPPEFKDEDANTTIEQLQHQYATWEPTERAVDFNDMVTINVESNVGDEPFISQQKTQFQVVKEFTMPMPGFAEELTGMKIDEEKEFNLQFPADYSQHEMAGKEATFKVKLNEVKQEKLPELNDEFAQSINPEFKNMEELREKITSNLKLRAEEKAKMDFEDQAIDATVAITDLEFPPIMVDMEIDRLISQQLQRWQMAGNDPKEYLNSINKTEEELREELKPVATKRITSSLTLGEITQKEKIEVSVEEIDAEINRMTENAAEKKEEMVKYLNQPQSRHSIEHELLTQKTVAKLVEIVQNIDENTKTEPKEEEK
ncbi:trigger factor [Chloroflexota bacterium]